MKGIYNGKILLEDEILEGHIIIFDDKIRKIEAFNESAHHDLDLINAHGHFISPGFIDVHVHGAMGHDVMDGSVEGLKVIGETIIKNGVTSYLPTTMTMPKKAIDRAYKAVKETMALKDYKGATPLGLHLEGPFINPEKKGAQNGDYIEKPRVSFIKPYLDLTKIVTYAPEMDADQSFVKAMKNYPHVALSIGHTKGTFEDAAKAIDLGVKSFTHLFNAMTGLHHREPGMVGAALTYDVYAELIADKIHVSKHLFEMLMHLKNDKLLLVTDGMSAKCMKSGLYELGGQKVIVNENSARLESGVLAGSILKLNEGVRHMKAHVTYPINRIINLATIYPARLIQEDQSIGSLEVGKNSDIIIFDEKINIKATFIKGTEVYKEAQ